MRIDELFQGLISLSVPEYLKNQEINAVCCDSRLVRPGSVFVAQPGAAGHGGVFIEDAVRKGATVIIKEPRFNVSPAGRQLWVIDEKDPHEVLIKLLKRFYGNPSVKLKIIGVTGTNGKTTVTYLLESILKDLGHLSGVIGTVNYRLGSEVWPAKNTTPGIVDNYELMMKMIEKKADYCLMEVSSHALEQKRVDGIDFRYAIYTNLTGDHLDYHLTEENYFLAKARLFTGLSGESVAVINNDDKFGERLKGMTGGKIVTYAISHKADVRAENVRLEAGGTSFDLICPKGKSAVRTRLIGRHNVSNILAAVCVCLGENIPLERIIEIVGEFSSVPGRLEKVETGQPYHVFIDYAHTEDALDNVLKSLKEIADGRIILVFGCGGDRDTTKRPKMGRVASRWADEVIVTNDNPRTEDPQQIIEQIKKGMSGIRFKVIPDRRQAIEEAVRLARTNDIVLVAGKGHEDYQIFKDKTIPFNEREIVMECLAQKI